MTSLRTNLRRLTVMLAALMIIAVSGCKTAKKVEEPTSPTSASADENTMGDSDHGGAMGLQTIHFPYDSFVLDGDAKSTLKANAQILKDKASVKIQIEGHADQHGGIQYNIALGEKRANSVKKYIQGLGVSGDRVTTISYGKERPVDSGSTPEADAKNRRANFVITTR